MSFLGSELLSLMCSPVRRNFLAKLFVFLSDVTWFLNRCTNHLVGYCCKANSDLVKFTSRTPMQTKSTLTLYVKQTYGSKHLTEVLFVLAGVGPSYRDKYYNVLNYGGILSYRIQFFYTNFI